MQVKWTVIEPKKITKAVLSLRSDARRAYAQMLLDLENEGPVPRAWNVAKLEANKYRLWLNYRYRVVYSVEENQLKIEVIYVGHKKDVPY